MGYLIQVQKNCFTRCSQNFSSELPKLQYGKNGAHPHVKLTIKNPPKVNSENPKAFQKCHRTPVTVNRCETWEPVKVL